jgi:hypothetical protein
MSGLVLAQDVDIAKGSRCTMTCCEMSAKQGTFPGTDPYFADLLDDALTAL